MAHPTAETMTRTQRDILEWVEAHRSEVIGLAQALVRIPSENKPPHGNERECQMFIADFMRRLGCRVDIFRPDEVPGLTEHSEYWPGRDYTNRPNVVGVLGQFEPGLTDQRAVARCFSPAMSMWCRLWVKGASAGGMPPFTKASYMAAAHAI